MREINVSKIKDAVAELCLKANFELRRDVLKSLKTAVAKEKNPRAKNILKAIIDNARLARTKRIAICQDTGMVIVHLEIGQNVALRGGALKGAVNAGVAEAYRKGYLRKSIVSGALFRENTKTNTPAVIYVDIVDGNNVKISVSPKGFGSENKSAIKMFKPTDSADEIKEFVIDVVKKAGPDACPPMVLGIGMGGTFERCAYLAKKALLRPVGKRSRQRHIARLETELERAINSLGIGPMGLGGKTTVLGVNVLEEPTHIAGLPVAVNVSCHATRSAEKTL
ncbi:MAG: fumarate hydratase [Candidatus Omnitrophica bacterium]|nr:fumarate hydratase [Candidatus Omnitrophota bacterium]